jgi:hypothetical protein
MTDRELLQQCLAAFEAISTASTSRKLLKLLGNSPVVYAGTGPHLLAAEMSRRLRTHLGLPEK